MDGIKCVIIGDEGVGKTSLIEQFMRHQVDRRPQENRYKTSVFANGQAVDLIILDTPGGDDQFGKRLLAYQEARIFIICFSLVDIKSLDRVKTKWLPEIKQNHGHVPLILVRTKMKMV